MSRSKRVLVVSRSTTGHPGAGGMEVVLEDLVFGLASSQGIELALLTTPGFEQTSMLQQFTHIWTVPGARPGKYSLHWWMGAPSHKSNWAAWAPDLILSISSSAGSFRLRRFWDRTPIVGQCHGTAWQEVKSSLASPSLKEIVKVPINLLRIIREKFAYQHFDRTIAISDTVAKQLTSPPLGIPNSKLVTVPNYVDVDEWKFNSETRRDLRDKFSIPRSSNLALFAGRLHPQKGADLVIRAMASFPSDEWHLIVCGTGPQADELIRVTADLGLTARVHFAGLVNRRQLPDYYSAADLLVFPTRRKEGLPMNILEALSSGLPVITCPGANLPGDLNDKVVYVAPTPSGVARAWSSALPPVDRKSSLPERYTSIAAIGEYELLLESVPH